MIRLLSICLVLSVSRAEPTVGEGLCGDPDQGWVSTLQYAPDTGFTYTLGSMRDGRNIPVFLGLKSGNRRVVADEENYRVSIPNPESGKQEQGTYEYRFRDLYTGTTHLSQESTWEFSVHRRITALRDLQLKWWENYLSAHLVAGRPLRSGSGDATMVISKDPLPVGEMFDVLGIDRDHKRMSIDSAIGKIDLQFSVPMGLVDHRTAPWRGRDDALLFHNEFTLKKGESLQLDMQVRITPDFARLSRYQPLASERDIYTPKSPISRRRVRGTVS